MNYFYGLSNICSECNSSQCYCSQNIDIHTHSQVNAEINLLNLGLSSKGINMGHINIQGLTTKIDDIKLMLT